jgi:glycine hydroxymethyltransferase
MIGLNANCNAIPDDPLPPYRPSGLRLGTPAITTRGLTEKHMGLVATWMHEALTKRNDQNALAQIRSAVTEFSLQFPLPSDR